MFQARSTFLFLVIWASPALANQCYNEYDSCNRSPVAHGDLSACSIRYQECLMEVERDAAAAARRRQEQEFRAARSGGHGGGYATEESEGVSPQPRARTILNTQNRSFSNIPLSPSRALKTNDGDSSRCPQSAYPYQGTSGVECTSSGAIAQERLIAVRGRVENEMMGFFSELSSPRAQR